MKKAAVVTLVLLFGLFLAANVVAAEKATKDECVAKTKEAAKLYSEKGEAEAIKEINNKQGKFVWKDTYVFMTDLDGKMLAHPMSPALVGTNVLGMKDKGSREAPVQGIFGGRQGQGRRLGRLHVDQPRDPKPRKKVTYVYRVPGRTSTSARDLRVTGGTEPRRGRPRLAGPAFPR
jgi:signal transduction histidine kinase